MLLPVPYRAPVSNVDHLLLDSCEDGLAWRAMLRVGEVSNLQILAYTPAQRQFFGQRTTAPVRRILKAQSAAKTCFQRPLVHLFGDFDESAVFEIAPLSTLLTGDIYTSGVSDDGELILPIQLYASDDRKLALTNRHNCGTLTLLASGARNIPLPGLVTLIPPLYLCARP